MSKQKSTFYHKALVSYLYFIQGVFLAISDTTTLTYKQMPSYGILGYFSFATSPFSFKFISAPLIEKYTLGWYGRRKTWVIASLICASIFLILATFFTQESETSQKLLAFCLTGAVLMISFEDVSTDALAVKELNSPQLVSYLQCIMQILGGVVGSLFYFQLVSGSLYKKLGFDSPFLTVSQYFCLLAGLTFASSVIIHLTYKQKVKKQQQDSEKYSLWEVIKQYKYFIIPKYRHCRQALTFIFYIHGLNYFISSYTVELIKNGHISKDLLTSLSNVIIIPIFIMTSLVTKYWSGLQKIHQRTRKILAIRLVLMMIFFIASVQSTSIFIGFYIIFTLLSNIQFLLNGFIVNSIGSSKFTGMFVSILASFLNFGNNSTIHLQVINIVGYRAASIFGFAYTVIILLAFGYIEKWIKNGANEEGQYPNRIDQKDSRKID